MSKADGVTTDISDPANHCDDEEELKVSIRLGGILPSDDDEEEEEDAIDNRSCEAPASPSSTTETGTLTVSENTALDPSVKSQITTLQEIASMESREYQQRLMENSVDTSALEDRSFIQLSQSLHRFHSIILNLNEENDSQTQEILKLQAQETESQNKIAQLEAVVSKLLAQNQRLRHKHRSGKSVNRKLVQHLHNINNAQQQEDETIDRLLQHEQHLRERCDSSNISSDLDGFDTESVYSLASNRSLVTSEPPTVRIHRERNLTWPHSDFGDDGPPSPPGSPEYGSPDRRYQAVVEGGKPSSPSNNFWNTTSSNHDPLHKVDRSTILDLGEDDNFHEVRRQKKEVDEKKKKKDLEPAFVHDFKVMFGKSTSSSSSPPKRKSTGDKFDLFDMFKKDDDKAAKSNDHETSTSLLPKRHSARPALGQDGKSGPTKKRESKTSIALDNAKQEAQEAADKFKSSMKKMGKMFDFLE